MKTKRYEQYCAVAHALDLVGERWSLLIVLELFGGPKRYTDLAANLPGIGTNILADRLRELERGGLVVKRQLPPPAASRVYELTEYGLGLKCVLRELALWGLRTLGPPQETDVFPPGWLAHSLDIVFAPVAPAGRIEFRIGGEVASLVDGQAVAGSIDDPDVVVEGEPLGFYSMFVERRLDELSVEGNIEVLERLLDAAAPHAASGARA